MSGRSADVDAQVEAVLSRARWTPWLVGAAFAVIIGTIVLLFFLLAAANSEVATLHRQLGVAQMRLDSSCGFYADLAGVPVTVGPNGRASELGVKLIADARAAVRGQRCPDKLPPAAASFAHWAKYYHLSPK